VAQPARFTFDLDLGRRAGDTGRSPGMADDVVAMLVAQARDDGYRQGLRDGETNATSMAAQTLAAAAGTLATQAADMAAALDRATAETQRDAIELAASIGRKLALHLLARFPTAELDALIGECMQSLNGVPHLVIRCNPAISGAIRDLATAQMQSSGFSGRLVVMGDPDLRLGDGKLEWVDGGLVRDIAAVSADIDKKISAYLAARGINHRESGQ
jgi:flagellar assembly protein FliH